jgi:hypothetical protein
MRDVVSSPKSLAGCYQMRAITWQRISSSTWDHSGIPSRVNLGTELEDDSPLIGHFVHTYKLPTRRHILTDRGRGTGNDPTKSGLISMTSDTLTNHDGILCHIPIYLEFFIDTNKKRMNAWPYDLRGLLSRSSAPKCSLDNRLIFILTVARTSV